jgi:hypothetical protein
MQNGISLGLQIIMGSAMIAMGLYFFKKAFSDSVDRSGSDGAFIGYLGCGFLLFGCGVALILLIGFIGL